MGSRKVGMGVVLGLIAIFIVSMTASLFPAGVNLAKAFFINVFMTAAFSAAAWWWIARFEKKQSKLTTAEKPTANNATNTVTP